MKKLLSHKEAVETVKKESKNLKDERMSVCVNLRWFAARQIPINMISKLFVVGTVFLNSTILETNEYNQQLHEWFYKEGHKWQLCYRASTDGWSGKYFHAKCDDKVPTTVLVKVNNYIFGGFTDTNWKLNHGANRSQKAFLFSLKNKDNLEPFKSPVLKVESATYSLRDTGAIFGNGTIASGVDLYIAQHPPRQNSYANLGHAYKLPDGYEKGTEEAGALLAGSSAFTPDEIEVYYRVKN